MTTTRIDASGIVQNEIERGESLEDVLSFIGDHIGDWRDRDVLWDMSLLDFPSTNAAAVRAFMSGGAKYSKQRSGLRSAAVVDPDLGFGMMRMLEILMDARGDFEFRVFRSKDDALQWLGE